MTLIIVLLFKVYQLMIFVRVITSWIQVDHGHPLMRWLVKWTEPVLEPVRRLLGGDRMMFDFSPLVVLFVLQLLERGILRVAL